jgi:hypothetical protein
MAEIRPSNLDKLKVESFFFNKINMRFTGAKNEARGFS